MKDLCQELVQSNLSEIGIATACKQLSDISREMKVENVAAFASSLLMPQVCRALWLRGRASDSRLTGPVFEFCVAVLKPWASFFILHCSSSLSCINEYLAIDTWWICVRAAFTH